MKTFSSTQVLTIEALWWTVIVALFTDSYGEFFKWLALGAATQLLFLATIYVIATQGDK